MGFSFGLTLNQKAMTMRIPSGRNMGVKSEPVDPGPEPDTIGVGPQNTRGVSLGSHHGDKTSNNSLKKTTYYLGFRVSTEGRNLVISLIDPKSFDLVILGLI